MQKLSSLLIALLLSVALIFPAVAQTPTSATATVASAANLRSGPGATFARVGSATPGQAVTIIASQTNPAGELWYQLSDNSWIAGFLLRNLRSVTPPTPTPTPVRFSTAGMVPASVTNIVDGDTIDVRIAASVFRLRYIGMDTPERGDNLFAEATAANRTLVFGKTVYLEKDISDTDRFDRLLRYVYLADGTFINAELVRMGYAVASTYPPDIKYQETLRLAQQTAVAAAAGMWASESAATAANAANLRAGPGTNYAVAGSVARGQALDITARNQTGDWLQLASGAWIFAALVAAAPTGLPLAANIPAPPAVAAPAAQPAASQPAPAAAQPAAAQPAPQPLGPGIDGIVVEIVENYSTAEILALRNNGAAATDVSAWRLDGSKGTDYCVMPSGTILQPGESFEVATGDSQPRGRGFKCGDKPIWNNGGETIFLKSADGRGYQIESRQVR